MNVGIYKQAGDRLAVAEKKAASLENTRSMDEAQQLWSEFLTEQQRFFNRLGHAMDTPSERGWFERLASQRQKDSVMQYLFQARHADEHGRQSIANSIPASTEIGKGGVATYINFQTDSKGGIVNLTGWEGQPGQPLSVKFNAETLGPIAVVNKNVKYEPPMAHYRVPTLTVAAIEFMKTAFTEARKYLQ